jgi:hypothetical protein
MIGAEKEGDRIAVEVKGFPAPSFFYQFHEAIGQYINYRLLIELLAENRKMYLAVPSTVYGEFFQSTFIREAIAREKVNLLVFHPKKRVIVQWIK